MIPKCYESHGSTFVRTDSTYCFSFKSKYVHAITVYSCQKYPGILLNEATHMQFSVMHNVLVTGLRLLLLVTLKNNR